MYLFLGVQNRRHTKYTHTHNIGKYTEQFSTPLVSILKVSKSIGSLVNHLGIITNLVAIQNLGENLIFL